MPGFHGGHCWAITKRHSGGAETPAAPAAVAHVSNAGAGVIDGAGLDLVHITPDESEVKDS